MNYYLSLLYRIETIYLFLALSTFLKGDNIITALYMTHIVVGLFFTFLNHYIYLIYFSVISLFVTLIYCYSQFNNDLESNHLPVIMSIANIVYGFYITPKELTLNSSFLSIIVIIKSIALFLVSLINIALVLLQRGEEGTFARDYLSNKFDTEDQTMNNSTMFFLSIYIVLSFLLSISIFVLKK